jgi:hypothetical protein
MAYCLVKHRAHNFTFTLLLFIHIVLQIFLLVLISRRTAEGKIWIKYRRENNIEMDFTKKWSILVWPWFHGLRVFVFHKSEFLGKLSDCQLLSNIYMEDLRVFTAVTMKMPSSGMTPCGFTIDRRFGGTCRFHIQGRRNNSSDRLTIFLARVISSTLKMEATRSTETSVYNKPTRRHIPEDGIHHMHGVY